MKPLAIFCADVGSILKNNFGWAALIHPRKFVYGSDIFEFAHCILDCIWNGNSVAIGFEAPLTIPVRNEPARLTAARSGEGNRSWSACAGPTSLATGLVEMIWTMSWLKEKIPKNRFPFVCFDIDEYLKCEGQSILLWEAFVSSSAKRKTHKDDAKYAVCEFKRRLESNKMASDINESEVLSLVGAAALRAEWSGDISLLSKKCLVVKCNDSK